MSIFSDRVYYVDGAWVSSQPSILSFLGDAEQDGDRELLKKWGPAGSLRDGVAAERGGAYPDQIRGNYWPTPTHHQQYDDDVPIAWLRRWVRLYHEKGVNSGVPYHIAVRAPVILAVAKAKGGRIEEAEDLLAQHDREPIPELLRDRSWGPTAEVTEAMMGFPMGWTALDD